MNSQKLKRFATRILRLSIHNNNNKRENKNFGNPNRTLFSRLSSSLILSLRSLNLFVCICRFVQSEQEENGHSYPNLSELQFASEESAAKRSSAKGIGSSIQEQQARAHAKCSR